MPAARFLPFFGKTRDEQAHDIWTGAQHGLCHRSERRFSHVRKQKQQSCALLWRKWLHRSSSGRIHLTAFVNPISLKDLERFTIWDLQGMSEHDIITIFTSQ